MPKIYKMKLSRLEECWLHPSSSPSKSQEPWWINYDNKISVFGLLSRIKTENTNVHTGDDDWTAADHARRIKYLANHPEELKDPIHMSSEPTYVKDPIPVINDGWHRLYAHHYLDKTYIYATWKGSRKLRDYLTGKTNKKPPCLEE